MTKALLLSGGMDSSALAYMERPDIAVTIDYGQAPSKAEVRASSIIASAIGIEHHVISVDCSSLGSGDLLNKASLEISPSTEWWPYRNQLLITLALMKIVDKGVKELMVASVKSDGFHKDGTKSFFDRINTLVSYQEGEIQITCPCIDLTTSELILKSGIPKSILYWAHSCHTSDIPCGNCRGCNKYIETLVELNYL